MRLAQRHEWNVSVEVARALQARLAGQVERHAPPGFRPRVVAAADMSHRRGSPWLYGAVVCVDLVSRTVIDVVLARRRARFPYVPGFLTFREGPVLLACFERLRLRPDAVLFDGQGLAHPRRLGLAAHLGVLLGVPSVGSAKSRLCGTHAEVGPKVGDRVPLLMDGERIGTVLRTRANAKPVYVSIGHRINLDAAEALVLSCCDGKSRVPWPIQWAHGCVNRMRKAFEA